MEWDGINIVNIKIHSWAKKSIFNILKLAIVILLNIFLVFFIFHLNQKNTYLLNEYKEKITIIENKLQKTEYKIVEFDNKQNHINQLPNIPSEKIKLFTKFISELEVKSGGINNVQMYIDDTIKLKISGKFKNSNHFEYFEKQLTNFDYNIEEFQIDDQNTIEFIITIQEKIK